MFDAQVRPAVSLTDLDAEIDRLLGATPSRAVDAARYHLSAGGARVRAQLGLGAAAALSLTGQHAISCAAAPELLHNASLVHDDLQDRDTTRRGKPTVWSRYGKDIALLTGDLFISLAYMATADHPHPAPAIGALHDAIATTIAGQTQDCRAGQPTPEECANIAADKSGPLLALPIRLALIAATVPGQDLALRAGRALAIAYQTLDDIADRQSDLLNDVTNICLSLEASGHVPASAKSIACDRAYAALQAARSAAVALPSNAGAPLQTLADRLEAQLKDISHAT